MALSQAPAYFDDEEMFDPENSFNINIDEIDNMIESSKESLKDLENNPDLINDDIIIIDELTDEELSTKNLIDYTSKCARSIIVSGIPNNPDDGDDPKIIDNKTTINPYSAFIKAKSVTTAVNKTEKLKYKRLMELIRKNKNLEAKRLKIRNMKLKLISIKAIYFIGKLAFKLSFSGSILLVILNSLTDPSKLLNISGIGSNSLLFILESIGILPTHLIHTIKQSIVGVQTEFKAFVKNTKSPEIQKSLDKYLENPSNNAFSDNLKECWKGYTTNNNGTKFYIEEALNTETNTQFASLIKLGNMAKRQIDMIFSIIKYTTGNIDGVGEEAGNQAEGNQAEGNQAEGNQAEGNQAEGNNMNPFSTFENNKDELSDKPNLYNFCIDLIALKDINMDYYGIIVNLGGDMTDLLFDIYRLNEEDVPPNTTPTMFLKRKLKDNLLHSLNSPQLEPVLENIFNPITQIYYGINSSSDPGSDESPILGTFSSIGNFVSLPNLSSIVRIGVYNLADSWFVVEDIKHNDKKGKKKTEFEERVDLRTKLYKENISKNDIDQIISDKFTNSKKYKSMLFKELNKLFSSSNFGETISKYIGYCFGGILAVEVIQAFSGFVLSSTNSGDSSARRHYSTTMSLLIGLEESLAIIFQLCIKAFKAFKAYKSGKSKFSDIFKIYYELTASKLGNNSKNQTLFGLPKYMIIKQISEFIFILFEEINNIISDTVDFINTKFFDSNNKDRIYISILDNKICKVLTKYTLILTKYFSSIYISAIQSSTNKSINKKIMSLSTEEIFSELSFNRFIDIFMYINNNIPTISKFVNYAKGYNTVSKVNSAIINAALSTQDIHVEGTRITYDENNNYPQLNDETEYYTEWLFDTDNKKSLVQYGINLSINLLHLFGISKYDSKLYNKKRREIAQKHSIDSKTKIILAHNSITERAYVINPDDILVDNNVEMEQRNEKKALFKTILKHFLHTNKVQLKRDALLNDEDLRKLNMPTTKFGDLSISGNNEKFLAIFLKFFDYNNPVSDDSVKESKQYILELIKKEVVGNNMDNFMEYIKELEVGVDYVEPLNTLKTKVQNYFRSINFKFKYKDKFKDVKEVVIHDSYIQGIMKNVYGLSDEQLEGCLPKEEVRFDTMKYKINNFVKDLNNFMSDMANKGIIVKFKLGLCNIESIKSLGIKIPDSRFDIYSYVNKYIENKKTGSDRIASLLYRNFAEQKSGDLPRSIESPKYEYLTGDGAPKFDSISGDADHSWYSQMRKEFERCINKLKHGVDSKCDIDRWKEKEFEGKLLELVGYKDPNSNCLHDIVHLYDHFYKHVNAQFGWNLTPLSGNRDERTPPPLPLISDKLKSTSEEEVYRYWLRNFHTTVGFVLDVQMESLDDSEKIEFVRFIKGTRRESSSSDSKVLEFETNKVTEVRRNGREEREEIRGEPLESFDPIDIAAWAYGGQGKSIRTNNPNVAIHVPKIITLYDGLTGNINYKTIHVPISIDQYNIPNFDGDSIGNDFEDLQRSLNEPDRIIKLFENLDVVIKNNKQFANKRYAFTKFLSGKRDAIKKFIDLNKRDARVINREFNQLRKKEILGPFSPILGPDVLGLEANDNNRILKYTGQQPQPQQPHDDIYDRDLKNILQSLTELFKGDELNNKQNKEDLLKLCKDSFSEEFKNLYSINYDNNINHYTLLPILFNKKSITDICTVIGGGNFGDRIKPKLNDLIKNLLGENIDYCRLKESSHISYKLRDKIQTIIYKSSINNMLQKIESYKSDIRWTDDTSRGESYDTPGLLLYNGNNIKERMANLAKINNYLRNKKCQELTDSQKHYLTLLTFSQVEYDTNNNDKNFFEILLKASGFDTLGNRDDNKFSTDAYNLFYSVELNKQKKKIFRNGVFIDYEMMLKKEDLSWYSWLWNLGDKEADVKAKKIAGIDKFLNSTSYIRYIKGTTLYSKYMTEINGKIDYIESRKKNCYENPPSCTDEIKVELFDKYRDLFEYLKVKAKEEIPTIGSWSYGEESQGTDNTDSSTFEQAYDNYKMNFLAREAEVEQIFLDIKYRVSEIIRDIEFRKLQETHGEQTRSDPLSANSDRKDTDGGSGNNGNRQAGNRGSQRNSEGAARNQDREGAARNQDSLDSEGMQHSEHNEQANDLEISNDLAEQFKESLGELNDSLEKLDEDNALALDETISEMQSLLEEMFSSLSDAFSRSRGLGNRRRSSTRDRERYRLEDEQNSDLDLDERTNKRCMELSNKYSSGSNYDERFPNIIPHDYIPEQDKLFLIGNCIKQGWSIKALDTFNELKSRAFDNFFNKIVIRVFPSLEYLFTGVKYAIQAAVGLGGSGNLPAVLAANTFLDKTLWRVFNQIVELFEYYIDIRKEYVNTATMSYQLEYLYDKIFYSSKSLHEIPDGGKFKFNNITYKKVGNELKACSNDNCDKFIANLTYTQIGDSYKLPTGEIISNNVKVIVTDVEYTIDEIIGLENPPDDLTDRNVRKILLANLYTIIGSKEYEDYAKTEGQGLDSIKFKMLKDDGTGRQTYLETGFNKMLLKKLWGVETLIQLRTHQQPLLPKPNLGSMTGKDKHRELLKLRNYKSNYDSSIQPSLSTPNIKETFHELHAIVTDCMTNIRGGINRNMPDTIKRLTLCGSGMSAKISFLVAKNKSLAKYVYGDNSIQQFILDTVDPASIDGLSDDVETTIKNSNKYFEFYNKLSFYSISKLLQDISVWLTSVSVTVPAGLAFRGLPWCSAAVAGILLGVQGLIAAQSALINSIGARLGDQDKHINRFLCNNFFKPIKIRPRISNQYPYPGHVILRNAFLSDCPDLIDTSDPDMPEFIIQHDGSQINLIDKFINNQNIDHNKVIKQFKDCINIYAEKDQYITLLENKLENLAQNYNVDGTQLKNYINQVKEYFDGTHDEITKFSGIIPGKLSVKLMIENMPLYNSEGESTGLFECMYQNDEFLQFAGNEQISLPQIDSLTQKVFDGCKSIADFSVKDKYAATIFRQTNVRNTERLIYEHVSMDEYTSIKNKILRILSQQDGGDNLLSKTCTDLSPDRDACSEFEFIFKDVNTKIKEKFRCVTDNDVKLEQIIQYIRRIPYNTEVTLPQLKDEIKPILNSDEEPADSCYEFLLLILNENYLEEINADVYPHSILTEIWPEFLKYISPRSSPLTQYELPEIKDKLSPDPGKKTQTKLFIKLIRQSFILEKFRTVDPS